MDPHVPRPSMPGTLRTVQIYFIIHLILTVLFSVSFGIAASTLGADETQRILIGAGASPTAQFLFIVYALVISCAQYFVIACMASRERGVQVTLRVLIGIGFISLAYQFFFHGQELWVALGLHLLLLCLAESPSAREWFRG